MKKRPSALSSSPPTRLPDPNGVTLRGVLASIFWREQELTRLNSGEPPPLRLSQPASTASDAMTHDSHALLDVTHLSKDYVDSNKLLGLFGSERIVHALDDVTLTLQANESRQCTLRLVFLKIAIRPEYITRPSTA